MTIPVATDFLRLFVEGFATLLADELDLAWPPSSNTSLTPIWVGAVPTTPNRVVTLTPYPLATDPTLANSTIGLQIRTRSAGADLRDAMGLDDQISNVLQGRYPLDLPSGVHVDTLQWTSGGSMGQDTEQRWSWSSNYTARVYRPGAHRL